MIALAVVHTASPSTETRIAVPFSSHDVNTWLDTATYSDNAVVTEEQQRNRLRSILLADFFGMRDQVRTGGTGPGLPALWLRAMDSPCTIRMTTRDTVRSRADDKAVPVGVDRAQGRRAQACAHVPSAVRNASARHANHRREHSARDRAFPVGLRAYVGARYSEGGLGSHREHARVALRRCAYGGRRGVGRTTRSGERCVHACPGADAPQHEVDDHRGYCNRALPPKNARPDRLLSRRGE